MRPETYLEHVRREGLRLVEVAERDLAADVPSCPDWDVADLLTHTAAVYAHKVACMQLGRQPDTDEWETQSPDGDVVAWFREMHQTVVEELAARGPDSPSYTWFGPDQTVGFWFRRMAHETAVHRVDAELALEDVTPIDAELATDGVDELLGFLCGVWGEDPVEGASGRTAAVETGGRSWTVTFEAAQVVLDGGGEPEVRITGAPNDVLLWLWGGRVGDDAVDIDGDVVLVHELRARLDAETN